MVNTLHTHIHAHTHTHTHTRPHTHPPTQLVESDDEESLDDVVKETEDEDNLGQVYSFRQSQADDDDDNYDGDDMAVSHHSVVLAP